MFYFSVYINPSKSIERRWSLFKLYNVWYNFDENECDSICDKLGII